MLCFNVQDDEHNCKFFKWLDNNTCKRSIATTPIVIAKFKRLESEVEVATEELKEAHAMDEAAMERERVAKRRAKRVKVACRIAEEKAEKFKIALLVSWVMFGVLLILSSRFGEVGMRQRCLP